MSLTSPNNVFTHRGLGSGQCAKGGYALMIRSYFGWERTPFTKEIETRHLHRSQRFEECIARLQYIVMTRSIGYVTGEIGTGKSTAIRYLKDQLDMNSTWCGICMKTSRRSPSSWWMRLTCFPVICCKRFAS